MNTDQNTMRVFSMDHHPSQAQGKYKKCYLWGKERENECSLQRFETMCQIVVKLEEFKAIP